MALAPEVSAQSDMSHSLLSSFAVVAPDCSGLCDVFSFSLFHPSVVSYSAEAAFLPASKNCDFSEIKTLAKKKKIFQNLWRMKFGKFIVIATKHPHGQEEVS